MMTKKQMEKLLDRHFKHQILACSIELQILNEVKKYKPNSELFYSYACIPYSEPYNFKSVVMQEIGEFLND